MAPTLSPVAGLPFVYRFEDCCNVYVVQEGSRALLIDLGAGGVLDALPSLGIERIDAVYFTHAHRDQCQGALTRADRLAGVPLHFPRRARPFVDPAARSDLTPPSPLVGRYPGRFDPPRPIVGAQYDLRPPATIPWGGFDLEIVALPGHIDHQVGYLLDVGEHRLAFCGDAIHSAGKIHEAFHLETDHYTGAGARKAAESLRTLRQLRPTALCPAHGPVTLDDPIGALRRTESLLVAFAELKDSPFPGLPHVRRLARIAPDTLSPVSPHLWVWNNSYLLTSDSGAVLMVDCGAPLSDAFWAQFEAHLRGRRIEVVLVTHPHCDHVDGIESLRESVGGELQVWAHEAIADAIEDPYRYRRPWLPLAPARVDRRLLEAEVFIWREYTFRALYFPGQTDLHAAYQVMIDGHHALFCGDNFYPPQRWGGYGGLSGLNGGHPIEGWRRSIDLLVQLEPEWLLAAHLQPFPFRAGDFEVARRWCDEIARAMATLAPDGCVERHHSPHAFALEPYAQTVRGAFLVSGRIRNPYRHGIEAVTRLMLPDQWRATPDTALLHLAPESEGVVEWSVTPSGPPCAAMLTLDLTYGGTYLGEKAECYVWYSP